MTSLIGLRPICLAALGLLGPSCCIAEGTLVETPSGLVPIENLRVGNIVWSVDVNTRERVAATILATRSAERECMAMAVDSSGQLVCTPDHPIFASDRGDYVDASQFAEGEAREVLHASGGTVRPAVVGSHQRYVGVRRVFDISVDGDHHNFIANGIVVHNKSFLDCDIEPGYCGSTSTGFDIESTGDESGSTSTRPDESTDSTASDTSTGSDTGTASDTSTGSDTGTASDTSTGSDTGTASDTGTGSDTGTASDTSTGSDTGTDGATDGMG